MASSIFFLFLSFSILNYFIQSINLSINEIQALENFYNKTNGKDWHWFENNRSIPWNFNQINPNPCEESWQGINCTCSLTICYVEDLILPYHNITGKYVYIETI
jgi:hypothetical protein